MIGYEPMCAPADFGIVLVMMIMRTRARCCSGSTPARQTTRMKYSASRDFGQNGMVLLVVVNDKEAEQKQSGEKTLQTTSPGQVGNSRAFPPLPAAKA
jgi:hypothetical protein